MNLLRRFIVLIALCVAVVPTARAIDISETLFLERYTIIDTWTVKYETGVMLKNGKFKVYLTDIQDTFGISIDPAVSGKVIIQELLYQGYKAAGIIPNWVRSRATYYIGGDGVVIVGVKGQDANPIPVISEQPQSQRVLEGNFAIFEVTASPDDLSYQWKFKDKNLSGETDSSLFLYNVTSARAGLYSVSLNAGGKSITSKKALLQVVKPVVVKSQPKTQTIKTGKAVTFRVAVSGGAPFSYQWYFNDLIITNATKSFYSISKAKPANAGRYAVMVSNGLSSATSTNAVLTVVP